MPGLVLIMVLVIIALRVEFFYQRCKKKKPETPEEKAYLSRITNIDMIVWGAVIIGAFLYNLTS